MQSKINNAIKLLEEAILSEHDELVEKHNVAYAKLLTNNEQMRNIIDDVANILHNIPHIKPKKVDKEIQTAWKILDHYIRFE